MHGELLTLRYGPYRERHHMRNGMRDERDAIARLIDETAPDVVNAHWAYEYALGALDAGYPTLLTVHDWGPAIVRYAPIPYWFARQLMYFAAVRRAPALSAVSPYLCERLERVATGRGAPYPQRSRAGVVWRVVTGAEPRLSRRILTVNHGFQARKNVKTLLRAFALVRQVMPACRLILVGGGFEDDGPACLWARERGLAEGVEFRGYVAHQGVMEMLDDVDLLAHPSLEEAFGLTLIEAMARGTPALGGKESGAVPWVLDGGRAGVLTDVRSPLDVAASIVALLEDPALWRYYSDGGAQERAGALLHGRGGRPVPGRLRAASARTEGAVAVRTRSMRPVGGTPHVYVVIPVHDRLEFTRACLSHLLADPAAQAATIVVVDDGSTDGTRDALPAEFPITMIPGGGDLWWAGAMNLGVGWVLGHAGEDDVVVTLNNDTVPPSDYLERLLTRPRGRPGFPRRLGAGERRRPAHHHRRRCTRELGDGQVPHRRPGRGAAARRRRGAQARASRRAERLRHAHPGAGLPPRRPVPAGATSALCGRLRILAAGLAGGSTLLVDWASPLYVHEAQTGIHAALATTDARGLLRTFWSLRSANDFRTRLFFALAACPRWALPLYVPCDYARVVLGSIRRYRRCSC